MSVLNPILLLYLGSNNNYANEESKVELSFPFLQYINTFDDLISDSPSLD